MYLHNTMRSICLLSVLVTAQSLSTKFNRTPQQATNVSSSSSKLSASLNPLGEVELSTRRCALSTLLNSSTRLIGASVVSSNILLPLRVNAISTDADAPTTSSTINPKNKIEQRLTSENLIQPPPSRASELNGIDNLYYPSWLEGEWYATQTLVDTSTPLGLKFVGGPNGSESIAMESIEEQKKQLNIPVNLKLRYVNTKFGVAEDRLFNTKQRLDTFAGRSVVSSVEYADVGGSNRGSVLMMGGSKDDPLQTTVVRFKGPAAQKSFLISHGEDVKAAKCGDKFAAYEVLRSIFALTNTNTAPPVTTDTELIWSFEKVDDDNINAKLRIASYLNAQSDKLYFEAKNQAVSFADYELKLIKDKSSR